MVRSVALIIGTFALMVGSAVAAAIATTRCLMSLRIKYHNNYEYYGQTPVALLIPIVGLIAFAAPGVIVWRLRKNQWRLSLRTLLIATTLIAAVLGLMVWAAKE